MATNPFVFDTGPSIVPDVGAIIYNGITFSPYFESRVSGKAVEDEARRTVKYMELDITVDGYATLPTGATDIAPTMQDLYTNLTAQGGQLTYRGRGWDLLVNGGAAGAVRDVAWGPIPELLEFQPLGGGLSAKVQWRCTTRIPNIKVGNATVTLLQFNYETGVSYDEKGYSTISARGSLEIPKTRTTQTTRTFVGTADDLRSVIGRRILDAIDLSRFRITRRNFPLSRDKRTTEWDVEAVERPYMDLPSGCTLAKGTYSTRPMKAGRQVLATMQWVSSLRATYTVRADAPRRTAWLSFLALLRTRMIASGLGNIPALNGNQNPAPPNNAQGFGFGDAVVALLGGPIFGQLPRPGAQNNFPMPRRAWIIDFHVDEGLYLDSEAITFSASWWFTTTFSHLLLASGLWWKVKERDLQGRNYWATTMQDISRENSWLADRADVTLDAIIDFGADPNNV